MIAYLRRRRVARDRFQFLRGGYREATTLEIWLVPPGESPPLPTPTVKTDQVVKLKGKTRYHCDL